MSRFGKRSFHTKSHMVTENIGSQEVSNTPEPLEGELGIGQKEMVTEGVGDIAKVVGFIVIGFWLVSFIGAIIFYSRTSKALNDKLLKDLENFSLSWEGKSEAKEIERKVIVSHIKDNNAIVNRLVVDCISEGKLWKSISGLISRGLFRMVETLPLTEAVIEVDKIYARMDEKTFVRDANELSKKVEASAEAVISFLNPLIREMGTVGFNVSYDNGPNNHERIINRAEALGRVFKDFVAYTGEEADVNKISTMGSFKIDVFVSGIEDGLAKQKDTIDKINKDVETVSKQSIDKDELKAFVKGDDARAEAYARLNASVKLLATASRMRAEIINIELKVEQYMLGLLDKCLKAEYKKKDNPDVKGIAQENIGGNMSAYQSCESFAGNGVEEAVRENIRVYTTLLNIGALVVREAGVQSELSAKDSATFNDSDVVGLLAARIQNRKKI